MPSLSHLALLFETVNFNQHSRINNKKKGVGKGRGVSMKKERGAHDAPMSHCGIVAKIEHKEIKGSICKAS